MAGTFGEWLRSAREEASLSMRALAERVEVSHSAINGLERGDDRPSLILATRLCRELGFDAWSVIDEFDVVPKDVLLTLVQSALHGPASSIAR